jgi:hypothetical protein
MPVVVGTGHTLDYVQPGDHIGLLTGPSDATVATAPAFVADGLRVLAVSADSGDGSQPPSVVVASNRSQARRIAANSGRPLLVAVDRSP